MMVAKVGSSIPEINHLLIKTDRERVRIGSMEELKDRNAYIKATNADGVSILEGTTTWCTQCKAIKPFVDQVGCHRIPTFS